MLTSKNLKYDEMKIRDIYQFKNWGRHTTPLLEDYNFIEETDEEIKSWYYWKNSGFFKKYFTVFKGDIAIGYIGFKKINYILRSSTLGIVLDPSYIDQRYGTEILNTMLDYYFNVKNFRKLSLYVAKFNKRAIRLYEKMGFVKIGEVIYLYDNGDFDNSIEDYRNNRDSFKVIAGKTFFYADKMVLKKEFFKRGE